VPQLILKNTFLEIVDIVDECDSKFVLLGRAFAPQEDCEKAARKLSCSTSSTVSMSTSSTRVSSQTSSASSIAEGSPREQTSSDGVLGGSFWVVNELARLRATNEKGMAGMPLRTAAAGNRPGSSKMEHAAINIYPTAQAPNTINDVVKISPSAKSAKTARSKFYFCRNISAGGSCPKGAKCAFAHSLGEMRGYKSTLCRNFADTGSCKHGQRCTFAHGLLELRENKDLGDNSEARSAEQATYYSQA
jgi:hypothetical protein